MLKWIILISALVVACVYGCSLWQTSQPLVSAGPPAALVTRTQAAAVEAWTRGLVDRFPHRSSEHPEQLRGAGGWIEAQLAGLSVPSARQATSSGYFNVLVEFGPSRGPLTVLGAHYDAHPATPGADDNASGVATLLAVAAQLRQTPPSCRVQLAFWTHEEPPHFRTAAMGSAHHARELKEKGEELRFALSVEMVGFYSDQPGSQKYPPGFPYGLAYPSKGNFILLLGDSESTGWTRVLKSHFAGTASVPIHSVNVSRSMAGADFSDHLNFWQAGYRAFMLTDTAFLRNPHYHRESDRPDLLDYSRMAQLADGVAAMALGSCPKQESGP